MLWQPEQTNTTTHKINTIIITILEMARCYETGLVQMTELKFDSQLSDPRIETLQHPSPSSGLADTEQTAFGKCQRGFMETSPRFCLPQAPLWSLEVNSQGP